MAGIAVEGAVVAVSAAEPIIATGVAEGVSALAAVAENGGASIEKKFATKAVSSVEETVANKTKQGFFSNLWNSITGNVKEQAKTAAQSVKEQAKTAISSVETTAVNAASTAATGAITSATNKAQSYITGTPTPVVAPAVSGAFEYVRRGGIEYGCSCVLYIVICILILLIVIVSIYVLCKKKKKYCPACGLSNVQSCNNTSACNSCGLIFI